MMFSTHMQQIFAVVLDRDVDAVTEELLRQGVLHFINSTELSGGWQQKVNTLSPAVSQARLTELRKRIENLMRSAGYLPETTEELDVKDRQPVDLDDVAKRLNKISDRIQHIREQQHTVQQEIMKLEDIRRQVEMFGTIGTKIDTSSRYSFLDIQSGSVQKSRVPALMEDIKKVPSVQLVVREDNASSLILLITMRRDESQVSKILERVGWVDVKLPEEATGLREEVDADISGKLDRLHEEQDSLFNKANDIIESHKNELNELWGNLRINELFYRIQSYFKKTSRTVLFTGWVPAGKHKALVDGISRVTGGRCYIEWYEPREVVKENKTKIKVPVKFSNPKILNAFQFLVKNYDVPRYGTIDPTPFVAIAYFIMFGLMFGDVGHGFVLLLIGIIGAIVFRKNETWRDLSHLVLWCSGAAILFGILFGSYFGMQLFPAVWFDFHGIISGHPHGNSLINDVYDVLMITIYFGIGVIGVGLLLNWINRIVQGQWIKLFFDKGGLIGGWMYAAGIYTAFYFVGHDYKELPDSTLLFFAFGIPAIILLLKPILEFAEEKKENPSKQFKPMTVIDFIMEWVVELLEIFTGYLANTLSFMRVAGLGIAHVSLMIATFQIAEMTAGGSSGGPYNVWYYVILVLGNVLVIALEGLSAGIQSLRLNYYEFFSRFFCGSGEIYMPVSLRSRD